MSFDGNIYEFVNPDDDITPEKIHEIVGKEPSNYLYELSFMDLEYIYKKAQYVSSQYVPYQGLNLENLENDLELARSNEDYHASDDNYLLVARTAVALFYANNSDLRTKTKKEVINNIFKITGVSLMNLPYVTTFINVIQDEGADIPNWTAPSFILGAYVAFTAHKRQEGLLYDRLHSRSGKMHNVASILKDIDCNAFFIALHVADNWSQSGSGEL